LHTKETRIRGTFPWLNGGLFEQDTRDNNSPLHPVDNEIIPIKGSDSERGEYHIPRAWAQGYRCIRIGWFLDFQAIRLPHVVRSAIQHLLIFRLDTFPLWAGPLPFSIYS
jgi:hypothetical protein